MIKINRIGTKKRNKIFLRIVCALLCVSMLSGCLAGCGKKKETVVDDPVISQPQEDPSQGEEKPQAALPASLTGGGDYALKAAVVCYSPGYSQDYTPLAYEILSQPMLLSFTVDLVDFSKKTDVDFSEYDLLYLDESLTSARAVPYMKGIVDYTYNGGFVMVPNALVENLGEYYFGGGEIVKFDGCTAELAFAENAAELGADLTELAEIPLDFAELYKGYDEFEALSALDYGVGIRGGNQTPLLSLNGVAVYSMAEYGSGRVFLTNPLLPNTYTGGSFSMISEKEAKEGFAASSVSFNMLLFNGFAKYVSKQKYGFALERSYGYFGTPSMSWELHYEEITGIEHGAMTTFAELCREYDQVPGFTIIRNSYQWFLKAESVSYLLNEGSGKENKFEFDMNESAYSSGKHIAAGGRWIKQQYDIDETSYFVDDTVHKSMAFPTAMYYDSDDKLDLFCGSRDGKIYYYHGIGIENGRLSTEEGEVLRDRRGNAFEIPGGYSSPVFFDVNGDGFRDLVSGSPSGKLYWAKCVTPGAFEPFAEWMDTGLKCLVTVRFADMDKDGKDDFVVGTDSGKLLVYYVKSQDFNYVEISRAINDGRAERLDISGVCSGSGLGSWLAPAVLDWDGDGDEDLLIGTYQGYVAVIKNNGKSFRFDSFITGSELNYKGNYNIKFGNYACPFAVDIDKNGKSDLICGSMEYGLAYPIDDPCFPFREELQKQIDYALDRDYYVGIHFYTTTGSSKEREAYELAEHRRVLSEVYGVDLEKTGTNQHTWYTSGLSETQTQESVWDAGFLWQSGFAASGDFVTPPQYAEENVVDLPFFMTKDGEKTLLVQNNSVLLYTPQERSDMSAKYHIPMSLFYHCDFCYQSDVGARSVLESAENFRRANGYNFCREDQMEMASAAVIHQTASAEGALLGDGLKLSSGTDGEEYPLYDSDVSASLGLRLCLAEYLDAAEFSTDSAIWYRDGNDIVIGLGKPALVKKNADKEPGLLQVNMAAGIAETAGGVKISFLSGGMMQAVVNGKASAATPGWTVTEFDGKTMFTKYGSNETLEIRFK